MITLVKLDELWSVSGLHGRTSSICPAVFLYQITPDNTTTLKSSGLQIIIVEFMIDTFSISRHLGIQGIIWVFRYFRLERKILRLWLQFNHLTQALFLHFGVRRIIELCIRCSSPYFLTVISGQTSFTKSKVIRINRLAGVTRMHDVS